MGKAKVGLLRLCMLSILLTVSLPGSVSAFVYNFVNEERGAAIITHPGAYSGSGGRLSITVGIDPQSLNHDEMIVPVRNAVSTWNKLATTTGNRGNLAIYAYDFESAVLHELGHALGLRHPNDETDTEFAYAFPGSNGVLNLDAGMDGHKGSADDRRGDDINLNWFQIDVNNPFKIADVVDASTYTRSLTLLPEGDNFAAIGSLEAAVAFSVPNTRVSMHSLIPRGIRRRSLTHDDVAGLRFAMAGIDESEGNSDDYFIDLRYIGLKAGADIMVSFSGFDADSGARLGSASVTGGPIETVGENTHARVTSAKIAFDHLEPWYFNAELSPDNSAWQNGRDPYDVTNDNIISARDALVVINTLNATNGGSRVLTGEPGPGEFFYDVTGDGRVSALDALRVINFLNERSSSGGEGEYVIQPASTRADRAREAENLDEHHGFHAPSWLTNINYYSEPSWNTEGVKFLLTSNWRWYYLTQAGALHQWGGNYANSPLVAILDSDYYSHPTMLYKAADQQLTETSSD